MLLFCCRNFSRESAIPTRCVLYRHVTDNRFKTFPFYGYNIIIHKITIHIISHDNIRQPTEALIVQFMFSTMATIQIHI